MAALKNPKHELFARALASGMSLKKAHERAGYHPHAGNAHTLSKKEKISERIAELLAESATQLKQDITYDRERLMGYLEIAKQIAIEKENSHALTAATVAMGRIQGLIIDRREVGDAGAFDAFTDEELVSAAAKKARELGIEGPHLVEDEDEEPEPQAGVG